MEEEVEVEEEVEEEVQEEVEEEEGMDGRIKAGRRSGEGEESRLYLIPH